ncbi:MAG: hypothetical protein IKI11_06370 [Neisseriaceae bacterium]|nr:hypothetical protein [Neisseriaceae bacterium]
MANTPDLQNLGCLKIGNSVAEMIACDLDLENRRISAFRKGIKACSQAQDFVSCDIVNSYQNHAALFRLAVLFILSA